MFTLVEASEPGCADGYAQAMIVVRRHRCQSAATASRCSRLESSGDGALANDQNDYFVVAKVVCRKHL
jgi:hypothetical protein